MFVLHIFLICIHFLCCGSFGERWGGMWPSLDTPRHSSTVPRQSSTVLDSSSTVFYESERSNGQKHGLQCIFSIFTFVCMFSTNYSIFLVFQWFCNFILFVCVLVRVWVHVCGFICFSYVLFIFQLFCVAVLRFWVFEHVFSFIHCFCKMSLIQHASPDYALFSWRLAFHATVYVFWCVCS